MAKESAGSGCRLAVYPRRMDDIDKPRQQPRPRTTSFRCKSLSMFLLFVEEESVAEEDEGVVGGYR